MVVCSEQIDTAEQPIEHTGSRGPTKFEWLIIVVGALLRLTQYLSNRSLWLDEANLALNIVNRSFLQLLKPLDNNQGAPIGFLMLERSAVQLFGPGEYALRLFPFLCGLISLLLFHRLARQSVTPRAVPIALGLFATSAPLIYYSSEVKQYSGDVLIAVLLSSAAIYYASHRLTPARVALFGLLGAAAIWFSHPAIFVLAGVGVSLVLFCRPEQRWERARKFSIAFLFWGLSLGACYALFLRHLSANQSLLSYWDFSFPPARLFSVAGVGWFAETFFTIFQSPVGLDLAGIGAFAFLVGVLAMFSAPFSAPFSLQRQKLFILLAPLVVTLLAATLHKYPFSGRLLLFAVPALVLVIAEGAAYVRVKTRTTAPAIGACLIGVLFFYPVLFSSYHLIRPSFREEIKPVLSYIQAHARPGDSLYIHPDAWPAFRYYAPRFHLTNVKIVQGAFYGSPGEGWRVYENDIDKLGGQGRVWLLFAPREPAAVTDKNLLLYFTDQRGSRLDSFEGLAADAYLYDLSRRSGQANQVTDGAK
jgi:Dolichyl-phosphate-mannose-protein mannosyltransferase